VQTWAQEGLPLSGIPQSRRPPRWSARWQTCCGRRRRAWHARSWAADSLAMVSFGSVCGRAHRRQSACARVRWKRSVS
jgi:hypothetical protein